MGKEIRETKYIILAILFFGIFSFLAGFLIQKELHKKTLANFVESFETIRLSSGEYNLIDPLVGTISPPATEVGIFTDIKKQLEKYLEAEKGSEEIIDYSFYYRELNSTLWFGINEEKSFTPASLLKLPIAIASYKQSEEDPNFKLNKKFVYTKEIASQNSTNPNNDASSLQIGKEYSVEELIELMIEKSDNGAKDLLFESMDKKYLNQFFELTNMDNPFLLTKYEISSKKYSLFLRILYNSSYINKQNSQNLLELLTKTSFKQGLVAGVPENTQVAHKFGVYNIDNGFMIHDCGIIYHPENAYLVCFMTKGNKAESLIRIIAHVSNMLYEFQSED